MAAEPEGPNSSTTNNRLMMEEEDSTKNEQSASGFKAALNIFIKHVLLRFLGLALYWMDISSDVYVAIGDYKEGAVNFAYLTIGFVFAPGVLFALYMFGSAFSLYAGELACLKAPLWLLSAPFLPLWPIVRDLWLIVVGFVATFSTSMREKMLGTLRQPSRVYLLKFTEAFAEAAPQLVVRMLKVSLRNPKHFSDLRTSEIVQMCLSLLTLGITVVSTHKKNISTQGIISGELDKHPLAQLPIFIAIFALIWWLSFIFARIEALALFAVSFNYWIFLVIGIHVSLLFLFQTIAAQRSQFKRIGVYLIGAFLFIFVYIQFNLTARIKVAAWFPYIIFSVVVFIENSVMLLLWIYKQRDLLLTNTTYTETFGNATFFNTVTNASYFNTTTSADYLNGTSSRAVTELYMDPDDLQQYWEKLIYVHFGAFAISLVFMILTFCCVPCFQKQSVDVDASQPNENSRERQRLTT